MNTDHAKRVLDHQTKHADLIQEILERIIAIENRLARFEIRTRDRMDDFLKGLAALTIRFDRLDAAVHSAAENRNT